MNILGSIFNIEKIVCNCFKPKNEFKLNNLELSKRLNIFILPMKPDIQIENLLAINTNIFNILVVDKEKKYVNIVFKDECFKFIDTESIEGNKGDNLLPPSLNDFLNLIYDKTFENNKVQLLFIYQNVLFLTYTYPLYNKENVLNGCMCIIMRYNYNVSYSEMRKSLDFLQKQVDRIRSSFEFNT